MWSGSPTILLFALAAMLLFFFILPAMMLWAIFSSADDKPKGEKYLQQLSESDPQSRADGDDKGFRGIHAALLVPAMVPLCYFNVRAISEVYRAIGRMANIDFVIWASLLLAFAELCLGFVVGRWIVRRGEKLGQRLMRR